MIPAKEIKMLLYILLAVALVAAFAKKCSSSSTPEVEFAPKIKLERTRGAAGYAIKIASQEPNAYNYKLKVNDKFYYEGRLSPNADTYTSYRDMHDENGFRMPDDIYIIEGMIYIYSGDNIAAYSFKFD